MRGSGTASSSLPRPRQSERPRRVLPSDRSPWRKHRGPPGSSPGSANVVRLVGADAGEEMAEHLRLAGRGSVLSVETQAQTLGWKGRPRRQGPAETGRDAGRVAGRSAWASRWRPLCRNGLQAAFPKPAGPPGALPHPARAPPLPDAAPLGAFLTHRRAAGPRDAAARLRPLFLLCLPRRRDAIFSPQRSCPDNDR